MQHHKRQSILVATGGYLPGKKYMGITTSRQNFLSSLKDIHSIAVLTVNHDFGETVPYSEVAHGWNTLDGTEICYLADSEITVETVTDILRERNITLVYASGTITSYFSFNKPILTAARNCRIPVLLTPDGDLCENAIAVKKWKKLAAILLCRASGAFRNVSFQVTSPEEKAGLQKYLGIPENRIFSLPFFMHPFTPKDHPAKECGKLKLVYCSRIHPIKNLMIVLEAVEAAKAEIELDIYGTVDDPGYWEECLKKIAASPKKDHIHYHGAIAPAAAQTIYRQYDCMILPTKGENYCFAIEEALTCQCPVLISRHTTPWDDIDQAAGFTVPLEQPEDFGRKLELLAAMNDREYAALLASLEQYIVKKLRTEALIQEYSALFDQITP